MTAAFPAKPPAWKRNARMTVFEDPRGRSTATNHRLRIAILRTKTQAIPNKIPSYTRTFIPLPKVANLQQFQQIAYSVLSANPLSPRGNPGFKIGRSNKSTLADLLRLSRFPCLVAGCFDEYTAQSR